VLAIAILASIWAVVARETGGVGWTIGPLRLSSRQPLRPLLVAVAAAIFYLWRTPHQQADADGAWLDRHLSRLAKAHGPVIIATGFVIGIYYGSVTAGGSDSYGYVSQASLWLAGDLITPQPLVQKFSWPGREWAFAPLGYRPRSTSGDIVPTYPAGLPMVMAVFLAIFGVDGPFFVVPVLASLALWATYALGREATGSRTAGAGAALMLLTAPVFLAHAMLPMTDVPVTAGWTAVCLLSIKRPRPQPAVAGIIAAVSLLIRPNLALLALIPIAAWAPPALRNRVAGRDGIRNILRFGVGLSPAVFVLIALNTYLYGSPIESGYGALTDQYALGSLLPNLKNYAGWLVASETPLVALALIPFFDREAVRRSEALQSSAIAALAALVLLTVVSYLFYTPSDVWFYLRYMLPALPAVFVLMTAALRRGVQYMPPAVKAPAAVLIVLAVAVHGLQYSHDQFIFRQREFERRHIEAAHAAAHLTPENAIILSSQHSGSIRYYAHRTTLRYDALKDQRLDITLRELKEKGYRPYIVLDDWEENEFRRRFAATSRAGALDWTPVRRVMTNPEVRIFDPEGRFE